MIPQIKCQSHNEEDIIMIDISKKSQRQNRTYCLECLTTITDLQKTCSLKKVPEKTMEYAQQLQKIIEGEQNKVNQTLKQIITLKEKTLSIFNQIIEYTKESQMQISKIMQKEQEYFNELINNMTEKSLQEIAEMLSGQWETRTIQPKEIPMDLCEEIAINLSQNISEQQKTIDEINQICIRKMQKLSTLQLEQLCNFLASNQTNKIVVGHQGNDLVVWEQNQDQLTKTAILSGHTDLVLAAVIFSQGDLIASGGEIQDKSIKLWQKKDCWKCIQTVQAHKNRINDLQITQNENQLVSASSDKLIMVWQLNQNQLVCIQTLDEHQSCVYWISIRQDSQYMVSSSSQNYLNLYQQEETDKIKVWKKVSRINTLGNIHRVFFAAIDQLLIQKENPPMLLIYQFIQNQYQQSQVIKLSKADNSEILFPIFKIRNSIFMKNEKYLYVIRKLKSGNYSIQQQLGGQIVSGCSDCYGLGLVSWSFLNKSIDLYSI